MDYELIPKVDETQEFIEIANDFSNPLDIVREAISNAFDAKAKNIEVVFMVENIYGNKVLVIHLKDDGCGMGKEELQAFFDLGNSTKRKDIGPDGIKYTIGEKGHGTKVYFNCSKIEVRTSKNNNLLIAQMDEPFKNLFDRKIPKVQVKEETTEGPSFTEIKITGYNNNITAKFTHEILKDYIQWFSKFGSIEKEFDHLQNSDVKLKLKGLNKLEPEILDFGHIFPDNSKPIDKLFDEYVTRAPDFYCKKIVKKGNLKNNPYIFYEAVLCIEGNRVKHRYNDMIRRPGYAAPEGAYTVQDRYGLWVCKDFIPIQRKNEWLSFKGYEYTKFHAFINCQDLRLTANRGSVDNTPTKILSDLQEEIKKIYDSIAASDDYRQLEWLEDEAEAYRTTEKEKNDFKWRVQKANKLNIAKYKHLTLIQPERESGVYTIVIQLMTLEPNLFGFHIIDYDTHSGIDVIVKSDKNKPINQSKLFYIEFKYILKDNFNHSFENLYNIFCWDTDIKHDEIIKDVNGEERKLQIVSPENEKEYTRYFLDNPRKAHKIEVIVLKDYLRETLKIDFRPRTEDSID